MKFVFIGMGGTNTFALRPMLMYLNSADVPKKNVIIIDGDSYEVSNCARQDFDPSFINVNKAEAKAEEFKKLFPSIQITAYPEYLDKKNIDYYIESGDVVLLAVDCMHTRRLVDNYAKTLNKVLLISMGNELTDGDVQIYCRVDNSEITPSIQDGHPEITKASNISRSEMSCEEIAAMPSGGQLIFANLQAATTGVSSAWRFLNETSFLKKPASIEYRGAYFDIQVLKTRPITNHAMLLKQGVA